MKDFQKWRIKKVIDKEKIIEKEKNYLKMLEIQAKRKEKEFNI